MCEQKASNRMRQAGVVPSCALTSLLNRSIKKPSLVEADKRKKTRDQQHPSACLCALVFRSSNSSIHRHTCLSVAHFLFEWNQSGPL